MGLTILAFISAALLAALGLGAFRRGRRTQAGLTVTAIDLSLFLFCLLHGLVTTAAGTGAVAGPNAAALAFSRLASATLLMSLVLLLTFSFAFPRWLGPWSRAAAGLAGLLALYLSWRILFTFGYMASVTGTSSGVIRITGREYALVSDLIAGAAVVSGFVHLLRAALTRDRIHRQRSVVAAISVLLGVGLLWLFGRAFPARSGIRDTYSLLPLGALAIGAGTTYAFSLSRLFDWREIGRRLLGYLVLALLFGAPAGAAIAFLVLMGRLSPLVPLVGAPLVFLVAYAAGSSFAARRLEQLRAREYREELESGLSHVDLAAGRDAVLGEVHRLLAESLDLRDFAVLIEDDHGVYRTVYSSGDRSASVERGSPVHEAVEASGVTVLLRTEVLAGAAWEAVREELLGFYSAFDAEALVFAREGRRIIGAFALGGRRTGEDYTAYDYDSLRAIYGKLFVIAYYLKNVARESILYTVDRELALSDQVVRFALEKVDPLSCPGVDSAWTTRSTRSLGGDFVDFVRISEKRWFFVLGDVSGKGLSASMNMLILKSMIRTFLRVERDFAGLVQRVNAFIKDNLPRGTFFAGVLGYFDFERNALYYLNCGIPVLLLYSPSFDAFIEVQGEGKVLGFVRDVRPFLRPRKLALPPGSAIAAATDGVLEGESLRGERFGKERLRRSIRERLGLSAREIADGVIEDLLAFSDRRQEDDITLLVLKTDSRSPA